MKNAYGSINEKLDGMESMLALQLVYSVVKNEHFTLRLGSEELI
jgi:hypothetical protein